MGELGEDTCELHREVGEYAAKQGIDLVCGIGPLSRNLTDGAQTTGTDTQSAWFETKADFLAAARELIREGDNVLVKASHGMQCSEIGAALRELDLHSIQ